LTVGDAQHGEQVARTFAKRDLNEVERGRRALPRLYVLVREQAATTH
jgi:hypothetical protein